MKNLIYIFIIALTWACNNNESMPLYMIKKDNKIGFIDSTGNVKIKPIYKDAYDFNEGLSLVVIDTTTTKDSINNYNIFEFTNKFYLYKTKIEYNYIDKQGNLIFNKNLTFVENKTNYKNSMFKIDNNFHFSNNLAVFYDTIKEKYGYIDKKGIIIIKPFFKKAKMFKNGLASVCIETKNKNQGLWGYINPEGKFVIDPIYDYASNFSEGLATVLVYSRSKDKEQYISSSEMFIINKKGNIIGKPFSFSLIDEFSEGYAIIKDIIQGYSFVDSLGNKVDNIYVDDLRSFSDGMAGIKLKNGKWGFINKKFTLVLKPEYDDIGYFDNGIAPVKINEYWGAIDKNGNIIIPFNYTFLSTFSDNLAYFKIKRDALTISGWLHKKGKVVWQKVKIKKNI